MSSNKDNRSSAFNLDKFYQDLKRVESSLGKGENRKSITSPLLKNGPVVKQQKSNTLSNFKKQLNNRQLTKTKINLDIPYEQKINKYQNKVEAKPPQYRGFQGQAADSYDKIREKLQRWRRQQQQINESIGQLSKVNAKLQKSEPDESIYSDFLQKTMETPNQSTNNPLHSKLLDELTKRNEVYQTVSNHCKQQKSYYKKSETDLSIKLQEHFREHRTMAKVIEEFKRICGLQIKDLKHLYDFLRQGHHKKMQIALKDSQEQLI